MPWTIDHPHLNHLYQYWSEKRHGRPLPSRNDIDPVEIKAAIWPHIMMLDVVYEGTSPRFRYRRIGRVFTDAMGEDPTGRFIDEVLPDKSGYQQYIMGIYIELCRVRKPMYTENVFELTGQMVPMLTKRLSLPLSNDGVNVNMVLAGHVFQYEDCGEGGPLQLINNIPREVVRTVIED
jgi:hypothetical protein